MVTNGVILRLKAKTEWLIFKIIIHGRCGVLRHALLLSVHLRHQSAGRGIVGLLVVPLLDEAREAEADAAAALLVDAEPGRGFVARAQGDVGAFDLPHKLRFKPDVRLVLGHGRMRVKGFRFVDGVLRQLRVQLFEKGLREAGAEVAYRLVRLRGRIVAGQEEGAVDGCPLSLAIVCA